MLPRALPVTHPPIALGKTFGPRKPLNARRLFRGFAARARLLLRRLGDFFAAGGPLS